MTRRVCFLFLLLLVTSCARHEQQHPSSPAPAKLTAADLAKLRWIEGYWRGSGVDQKPFFERYRFENPTTLVVEVTRAGALGGPASTTRAVYRKT